jgi:hypothetical protein
MTTKLKKLQKKVFNISRGNRQEQEEVLSDFISYAQCYDEQKIGMRFAFLTSSLMMLGLFPVVPALSIAVICLLILAGVYYDKLNKPDFLKNAENKVIETIANVVENTIISHDGSHTQTLQIALQEQGIKINDEEAEIIVEAYTKDNNLLLQKTSDVATEYSINYDQTSTDSSIIRDTNLTNKNLEAVKKLQVVKKIAKDITLNTEQERQL